MRIDASSQRRAVENATEVGSAKARPASVKRDKMTLSGTDALDKSLQTTPAVRPEKVARAKELLDDPGYPSAAVLNRVADLLTQHLQVKD